MRRDAAAIATALNRTVTDRLLNRAILEQALSEAFTDEAGKSSHAVDKSGLSAVPGRPLGEGEPSTIANARPEPKRGGNPDNRGQFSKTPGSGQREGETPSKRDAHGTFDEAKLAADPRANKTRAKSVITHLLAKKGESEPKALYRKDTGWIGIDYGTPGNPDNDYKGGHGLAHIIAKHPGAEQMLIDTLLNGEAYKHPFERRKLCLIRGNYVAVLSKMRNGRLLITDFKETRQEKLSELKSQGLYHSKGEN